MSDTMINKFTELKLFTVVNILQKHCDLSGYTVLDGRTLQTESVAHQKNKADKTHSAYSLNIIPARETAWYKKCTVKVVPAITSNSGNGKYKLKVVETVKSDNYCNQSEITVRNVIQL